MSRDHLQVPNCSTFIERSASAISDEHPLHIWGGGKEVKTGWEEMGVWAGEDRIRSKEVAGTRLGSRQRQRIAGSFRYPPSDLLNCINFYLPWPIRHCDMQIGISAGPRENRERRDMMDEAGRSGVEKPRIKSQILKMVARKTDRRLATTFAWAAIKPKINENSSVDSQQKMQNQRDLRVCSKACVLVCGNFGNFPTTFSSSCKGQCGTFTFLIWRRPFRAVFSVHLLPAVFGVGLGSQVSGY